jgi:DNA-binding NarL/FixJ family response regulator/signal transduction histidine kinase
MEQRCLEKDGQVLWASVTATLIRDDRGRPLRTIAVVQDVTDRKRVAEALRQLNETLEQRVAQRTALVQRRNEQLRRLAAELSSAEQRERKRIALTLHDHLQQILVAAKYGIHHLKQETDDSPLAETAERVDQLIQQSLDASRSLTVELSPPVLYDRGLGAALEWLARHFREQHGLEVAVEVDPEVRLGNVNVEAFLLQAVRELLFNVVKHAGTNEASVRLARAEEYVTITVEDRGEGCPPEKVASYVETETGFGLFNIQQRLDLLGGRCEVETAPGRGFRISLHAPVAGTELETSLSEELQQDKAAAGPAPRENAGAPRTIRVLIADDHRILREGLTGLLRAHADIELVGQAENGVAAVELTRQPCPDVVVMDVSMPRMDGIEATRLLTQEVPDRSPQASPVRVVMLTTFDLDEYIYSALGNGASGFLLKDTPPEELVRAVRTVASGEALLAPSVTRLLIAQIAETRPRLARPPELESLSSREREVLLLVAKGLSNTEIAEQLILGEATVKTHVRGMLNKLGVRDRVQAVVLAYESGLVTPGQ